jgi:peptidoglycan biosynthesis protein MviN/MurJ (putative lipid II flippase)
VLLGGEAFDDEDVATTTMLLVAFSISVPLESLTQLLARAIYATRNTILAVIASIVSLVVTVLFVNALAPRYGVAILPLGFALGMAAKVAVLAVGLVLRVRRAFPVEDGRPVPPVDEG